MTIVLLVYLGGVLTILSPCILPVLPFVFARSERRFASNGLPMLAGMALSFAAIATLGQRWAGLGRSASINMGACSPWCCSHCLRQLCCHSIWRDWLARPLRRLGATALCRSLGNASAKVRA